LQSHHMPGNSPGSPSNLLGNVRSSLAQPDLASPVEQPVVADPMAQPTDVYVAQHQPVKRHLGQRGRLVGGVLLTAGLLLGAASLSEGTTEIDHMPEGITRLLDGEVPGLDNSDLASAQLFAELDGEMVPMEIMSGMHSDLLSSSTLASAGPNLAAVLASAKPKGKWGKIKKWMGTNAGTKWLKKKLKKPAAWVAKHPFASLGIMFALSLFTLGFGVKWLRARGNKGGKKIYRNDIPVGHLFDTGNQWIVMTENEHGQRRHISTSEIQRDVLAEFKGIGPRNIDEIIKRVIKNDPTLRESTRLTLIREVVDTYKWLHKTPDGKFVLVISEYNPNLIARRLRYWVGTRHDEKVQWAKRLVAIEDAGETVPRMTHMFGWLPGVMTPKKAKKFLDSMNQTMVMSDSQITKAESTGNGSNRNGKKTTRQLHACYTSDGDTAIIYRTANDPLIFPGWQGKIVQSCANRDPGPTPTLLMTYLGQYPEATEYAVRDFLRYLVSKNLMTDNDGFHQLRFEKGTDEDAKRLGKGKEPVAFYTPSAPPPRPKLAKPQYKMSEDGSTMLVGTPGGDVFTLHDWEIRTLLAAKEYKTPTAIFEGIGLDAEFRIAFDAFIKRAINQRWLMDLGDPLGVQFKLSENRDLKAPKHPHPKSVPALRKGTDTAGWGTLDKGREDTAARPSSPPKAAPPVVARPEPETSTRLGNAPTEFVKGSEVAKLPRGKPQKEPDPPHVQAKPVVPPLNLPKKPATRAAASVTTPPAPPEAEDVIEIVADIPEKLGRDGTSTKILTPSAMDGLAASSDPQATKHPTRAHLGSGKTEDDPMMLSKPLFASTVDKPAAEDGDGSLASATLGADRSTHPPVAAKPAAEEDADNLVVGSEDAEPAAEGAQPPATPMDAELTTEFERAQVEAALAAAESNEGAKPPPTPLDAKITQKRDKPDVEEAAKKPGPPPRGRKARTKRPGESKMTIRRDPEGVAGHTMQLEASDLVEVSDGDDSDEG